MSPDHLFPIRHGELYDLRERLSRGAIPRLERQAVNWSHQWPWKRLHSNRLEARQLEIDPRPRNYPRTFFQIKLKCFSEISGFRRRAHE